MTAAVRKEENMIDIIQKTLAILNANNEWQKRYGGYLSDIWVNSNKYAKGFHKPEGLSVYTTVGDRNTKNYYLRFKGQNVGKVKVSNNGIVLQGMSKVSKSHDIMDCPLVEGQKVDWESREAADFRQYFKSLSPKTKTKSPEHEVENALLKAFRMTGEKKPLRHIQPVLLHGNFFQMPTPLTASTHKPTYANQNGGGIDMLARIKTTKTEHIRLCVIEIKDENKDSESQKAAMSQAITYATFIAVLLQKQPDWMEFFMGHKSKRGRMPSSLDELDIEVITIMPKGNTEVFEDKKLQIPNTNYNLHCHSLYYDKPTFEEKCYFDFSGTLLNEIKK